MKIGFIGGGYVGLVSAIMTAYIGHNIVCIDKDEDKIKHLKEGKCIIYEKNLALHMRQVIESRAIIFSEHYKDLIHCDVIFICVGTPSAADGMADLSYVEDALLTAAQIVPSDCLLVIKSTVPPGSCIKCAELLRANGFDHKIASNPEFLREGSAVHDFLHGDRIVAGGDNASLKILQQIFAPLIEKGVIFLGTDTTTSEMIKYCSNSFLSIKLSFINEMANLCEAIGADITTLSEGIGLDKRIGPLFLKPGPGYGGSCFPKDTLALAFLAQELKIPCDVLNASISSNMSRYRLMSDKIKAIVKKESIITILGLTFKANTDDVRESPAIKISQMLEQEGYVLQIYDPVVGKNFSNPYMSRYKISNSIFDATKDSHAIVILTEWQEFAGINYDQIGMHMKERILIDFRLIANLDNAKKSGFTTYAIGKNMAPVG